MKLETQLEGTQFELELATALLKFIPTHMEKVINNPSIPYQNYGTETEKKVKSISTHLSSIYAVLKDIDLSILFLKKERRLILDHYPDIENQESYYNYHFENYVIRLVTISDIIGRLGNILYDLGIDPKKSSAYTFKDSAKKKGYDKISLITEELIDKLESLKNLRHEKLHTGLSDIKLLKHGLIWEDLNKAINIDTSDILQEYTDIQINEELSNLEKQTSEIIEILKKFLNESFGKLRELIDTLNTIYITL